jgi:Ca2+-binding EF-hand superfamily protein
MRPINKFVEISTKRVKYLNSNRRFVISKFFNKFFKGSRKIDFSEFSNILAPILTGKFDKDQLLYVFKSNDLENSGEITGKELKEILLKVSHHFTEKEISDLIEKVSETNNGKLSFPGNFISILNIKLWKIT